MAISPTPPRRPSSNNCCRAKSSVSCSDISAGIAIHPTWQKAPSRACSPNVIEGGSKYSAPISGRSAGGFELARPSPVLFSRRSTSCSSRECASRKRHCSGGLRPPKGAPNEWLILLAHDEGGHPRWRGDKKTNQGFPQLLDFIAARNAVHF